MKRKLAHINQLDVAQLKHMFMESMFLDVKSMVFSYLKHGKLW